MIDNMPPMIPGTIPIANVLMVDKADPAVDLALSGRESHAPPRAFPPSRNNNASILSEINSYTIKC
jgi:hypothetical protein